MAGHISLYSSLEDAIREEGSVIYDESSHVTNDDIVEYNDQLQQFSSSFNAAYHEYLKLCTLGANNIVFTYLPIRNTSFSFPGGPVPLNLRHIIHGYGFPTFSQTNTSRNLLYDLVDVVRNNAQPLGESDTSKVQYYDNLVKNFSNVVDRLDVTATTAENFSSIAEFFYYLSSNDRYGNVALDGLIDCNDFDVKLQTLGLINKLLYFSYREQKVDLEWDKLSRPEDIQRDMAYEIFNLRKSNLGLYKSIFDDPTNQELVDYVTSHATKHYTGTRNVDDLIKNGKREYLRLATLKSLKMYHDGTLDSNMFGIDIPARLNSSMSNYYKRVSKSLKSNPLNTDELTDTIFKDDISIYELMKFKYYFENNKNDDNYNEIKDLFIDRFNLSEDFSIDEVISNRFFEISDDLSLGKGDPMDVSFCGGLTFLISNDISRKVSLSHIGIGFNSPNNYSDVLDYIGLDEGDFKDYKHDIISPLPSIEYVKSRYLSGNDNISDLIEVKRKVTSSIVKDVLLRKTNLNAAIRELESYDCGNYLDILNAIFDTPECMNELNSKFINGEEVFNLSRITQKCDSLKGLGSVIDNNSGVKIMTAVEDLYYSDTGNNTAHYIDSNSHDTVENFIMFIPGTDPNIGTSVYLELKDVGGLGNFQLVPSHVYPDQRLEYHNYGGKGRVGITIHVDYRFQHLPLDRDNTNLIGSSSAPQDAQLEAMLDPNFNYSSSSGAHSSGGLGGGHR